MAGARAVAVATPAASPRAAGLSSHLSLRCSSFFRLNCQHHPRVGMRSRAASGRARLSGRDPADAGTDAGGGRIFKEQDDSRYLLTLGLGSVGGAAVIKYGSILLPDITRPNVVLALLMVSLPVAAAVLILIRASSAED